MSTTRYTIDLDKDFDTKLTNLAREKNTTKAEIIKRALATYSVLSGQVADQQDKKVSITTKDDKVLKDVIIP